LPVPLYGCGIFTLSLREEHRPKVFEKRVLWKISGPNRKWQKDGENNVMGGA